MIQRIQTVYLLLTFCLMAILVYFPFSSSPTMLISAGVIALLAFITIFLYKKRKLQIKICYLILLLLVVLYVLDYISGRQYLPLTELFRTIRYTFVFPLVAGIFVYLAIRSIKKDEKLVRSLDRLR